ncbi:hypothetical protein [Microbulbifer variabilis]|uniref:hypothetical protein n=1 Tax=Microbulbifer variabilis TaxID=266805 RepID=UPI001CFD372E|nr:hypothetical protein [Microbulbifer variabilis]
MIFEREVNGLDDEEHMHVPRIELSLLVSEVGAYSSRTVITLGGVEYSVRKRLWDDGIVW